MTELFTATDDCITKIPESSITHLPPSKHKSRQPKSTSLYSPKTTLASLLKTVSNEEILWEIRDFHSVDKCSDDEWFACIDTLRAKVPVAMKPEKFPSGVMVLDCIQHGGNNFFGENEPSLLPKWARLRFPHAYEVHDSHDSNKNPKTEEANEPKQEEEKKEPNDKPDQTIHQPEDIDTEFDLDTRFQGYGIDLSPWDQYLSLPVSHRSLKHATPAMVLALSIVDMTFYSKDEKVVEWFVDDLKEQVNEIKKMMKEMTPEQLQEEFRPVESFLPENVSSPTTRNDSLDSNFVETTPRESGQSNI